MPGWRIRVDPLANLLDAGGLDNRTLSLALRESASHLMVRVHAGEFHAIGVIEGHEPMMVFPSSIVAKRCLLTLLHYCDPTMLHLHATLRTRHLHSIVRRTELAEDYAVELDDSRLAYC